jgi:hypothetical protein
MFVKINTLKKYLDESERLDGLILLNSKTYDVKSAEFIYDNSEPEKGQFRLARLEIVFADDVNNSCKVTEIISCGVPDYSTEVYFMNDNGKTIDSFEF